MPLWIERDGAARTRCRLAVQRQGDGALSDCRTKLNNGPVLAAELASVGDPFRGYAQDRSVVGIDVG